MSNNLTFRVNRQALWNTVEQYQQELSRNRSDQNMLTLAVVDELSRPVVAKLGELKGQVVVKVTMRPLLSVTARSVHVIGLHTPLLADNEWRANAEIERLQRIYRAVFPDRLPPAVRAFLLCGSSDETRWATPRVLGWLGSLYEKLSKAEGDYAAVEAGIIRARQAVAAQKAVA